MHKQLLFICILMFGVVASRAQNGDSWKVYHNKQLIFEADKTNIEKNYIILNAADLENAGYILISYQQANTKNTQQRIMALADTTGNILLSKTNISMLSVLHGDIKNLFTNNSILYLVTWLQPANSKNNSISKSQQTILCTIRLQ